MDSVPLLCKTLPTPIPEFLFIFSVEALSIVEARHSAQHSGYSNIKIFSDSKSVLLALTSTSLNGNVNPHILKLKSEIFFLTDLGFDIFFTWIPAYKGIIGNELVDKLTKKAITSGRNTTLSTFVNYLQILFKNKFLTDTEAWLRNSGALLGKGISYFHHFYSLIHHPWFSKFELNRREIASLSRLRTSHTSLKESLFRFKIVGSPNCPTCDSPESPDHIFWQCPRFQSQRNILISKGIPSSKTLSLPICSILSSNNPNLYKILANFISNINIFI